MFGYKCDKCGTLISIDPGEERICDQCLERERAKEQPVKMKPRCELEAVYAG